MWKPTENKPNYIKEKYGGGPHGLGDPDDQSLRKVEMEVLIPKKMREIAKQEKCSDEVKEFSKCCKDKSLFMVVMCRKENTALKECLTKWYEDEQFKERCKKEYLAERTEFRKTGMSNKKKVEKLPISM